MRFRNSSGERIRNSSGERTNTEDCCCDGVPCEYCSSGSMPSVVSVTFTGFSALPWTYLNNTFVATTTGDCVYEYNDDADPCGETIGGSYGACIRVFIGTAGITVRLGGVFPYLQLGFIPGNTYGAWLFNKSFGGGDVTCSGNHSLTTSASQYNTLGSADCSGGAIGSDTIFDQCDDSNTTETPSCSVTF